MLPCYMLRNSMLACLLVLMLVAPLPAFAATCYMEPNYDYSGGDITSFTSILTAQACCDKCASYSGCKAWTWNLSAKVCYLKRGVYGRSKLSGTAGCTATTCPATSGVPAKTAGSCTKVAGYDFVSSSNLASFSLVSSDSDCCAKCHANSACNAWTWNSSTKYCYLKTKVTKLTGASVATSGVVNRGTDLRKCVEIQPTRPGLAKALETMANGLKSITYTQCTCSCSSSATCWDTGISQYCTPPSCRWSGIKNYVCPIGTSVPPYADCSSFDTWLYWTAFGQGIDMISGSTNWSWATTGSMDPMGVIVSSLANAQVGDLIFYPGHVAFYMGNNKVANFGSTGAVKILDVNYRTPTGIRSYPTFFY